GRAVVPVADRAGRGGRGRRRAGRVRLGGDARAGAESRAHARDGALLPSPADGSARGAEERAGSEPAATPSGMSPSAMAIPAGSPGERYAAGVAKGDWQDDPAQRAVLPALDRVWRAAVEAGAPSLWQRLRGRKRVPSKG